MCFKRKIHIIMFCNIDLTLHAHQWTYFLVNKVNKIYYKYTYKLLILDMLLCISCSSGEFPMTSYIVLHKATNWLSDIDGKDIWGFLKDGFQLVNFLSSFKSFKFDSKINK